jgi:2-polyprenyl-6-methoxyphenol hydroxylase-like FAD-dependent oxidoreductase
MESPPARPVSTVGAGLAGLILAQALSARSIPYLIYEQDPHASHRGVGWGLTIHWALGIFKSLVPASIMERLPDAFVDPDAVRSGEKGNFLFYDLRRGQCAMEGLSKRAAARTEGRIQATPSPKR